MSVSDSAEVVQDPLRQSIDALYHIFARYPLAPHVDGCPHCVTDADHRQLYHDVLRRLTANDLSRFAFKALTTWGDSRDFRHFLPRLFELQTTDQRMLVDDEVLFSKLRYDNWHLWPADERSAVQQFMMAWGASLLASYPSQPEMRTYLCCLALTENVRTFLEQWRVANATDALRHLAQVATEHAWDARSFLSNWWNDVPAERDIVDRWLRDPTTESQLEEAFFQHGRESFAPEFASAVDWIRRMHR